MTNIVNNIFTTRVKNTIMLLVLLCGINTAVWADPTKSTWDGTVPSTANVSKAVCNGIGITGSGTEADPYVISTAQQFAYFASKMSGNTAWWKLADNVEIDLDGVNRVWTYGQNGATFKGHFDGNKSSGSLISNMKFETTATGKGWGLFPNLQGSSATNHAEIKNLTIKNFTIATPTSGSYASANIGLLVGKANGFTDIENITVTGGSITVDVETTGGHNVAGLVGQLATNENNIKNCSVSGVSITSGTAQKKEYYVGGITGNAGNYAVITGNTVSNLTITIGGKTNGNNVIGGLIGKIAGVNSTVAAGYPMGKRSLVQKNTVTGSTITMNGSVDAANFYLGGMIGWIGNHTNAFNNKVTSPTISLNNNISAVSYVGGAIGYQDAYTFVDGMTVGGTGGSINGPSSDKTVKNGVTFFVGGYLGYQVNSGTTLYQANKFKNVAVTGMNINLANYKPGGQIKDHKFSVGGIAGSINAPNMSITNGIVWVGMPENVIFKGGKIYAPWASTSPTVSNFNAAAMTHQNMTLDVVTTIDAIEKAKANTWYYNDYKLGLSSEFLGSDYVIDQSAAAQHLKLRKNYSATPAEEGGIKYLTVDNNTFAKSNRYQDSERDSKTVLWWTQQASMDNSKGTVAAATCFTANEQPIYPQSGATSAQAGNLTNYPHYMYFFQGVANAKYADNAAATKIVEGIEANFTNNIIPSIVAGSVEAGSNAVGGGVTVTIFNNGETSRGFDTRTLTATLKKADNTAATGSYTYQWYVDGVANGTGTTLSLTPHWKNGQGVTVNVLSGGTIVATASYGFAPGILKTKDMEPIRSDFNSRGTSSNPYIIDCESALRQLSYLSTAHTSIFWETLGKPASPYPTNQTQGHYNRAYYKLGENINLGGRDFIPISHVGYGADGSWGTYTTNFIFQGVFDGAGYTISNFNIKWGASQYVGNNANLYYGLFGAVGNATAARKWGDTANGNTVIKNLIISGATLKHNTAETSFYYAPSISTNANYALVGVLAGVVTSNTTIQNIEIRNSKITDDGSGEYSLATKGLYVGGAIGSVQSAYNKTDAALANTQIQHIAAQVNITLTNPTIADISKADQLNQFNVGGIIGRYCATSATQAQTQASMAKYTIYSGTINAPKAWISPVLGALRYSAQQNGMFANYSRQWDGNNNTPETQINISNALYYNFTIGTTKVTESEPSNICTSGSRTMSAHADITESALTYNAAKYQGVNYNARYVDVAGASLEHLNGERYDYYSWIWDNGFVHMTTAPYVEAKISRTGNTFTASLDGATASSFKWKASFDGTTWIDIPSVSSATYTAPASLKPKYIVAYVSDGAKEYRTLVEVVAANENLCNPTITKSGSTYTFNLNSTADVGQLATTYLWYENKTTPFNPNETSQTLTLTDDKLSELRGIVWCKATVTELEQVVAEYFLISGATVVYVKGDSGNDENDGLTPDTPVKTIDKANSLLKKVADGGSWDSNIIVVIGILDSDHVFQSRGTNPATLTGVYDGTNYNGVIRLKQVDQAKTGGGTDEHLVNKVHQEGEKGANCYVLGDTKFENLTFYGNQGGNTFLELHGRDVIFGRGLVMQNFKKLSKAHGNFNETEVVPEFTVVLTATNLCDNDIKAYTNRTKPQVVTFQSGHYGRILAGRFTQNFFNTADNTAQSILGSAAYPVWAVINVEIDAANSTTNGLTGSDLVTYSRDINAVIAGLTDGSMYGDFEINLYGGNVAYIVGANQGNPVSNGTLSYTPLGGTSGTFGQWPNSSYFGRTVINIDQKSGIKNITVGNLYAGGLGREVQSGKASATVDMYIYGRTEVNVKSGSVGNVYGGGVGGVIGLNPWDAHVPYQTSTTGTVSNNAIHNGVQYGDTRYGSWSNMTTSSPLASVVLHNLNESGDGYVTENLDLRNSSTTVNISGGNVNGNVYGGGYGFVQDMSVDAAMQGIGSVFGTTNINISGGNIIGDVYGGSQGASNYFGSKNKYGQTINHIAEMNGIVNMNIFGSPNISGDIFGAGQGIASNGTQEYLRIATTGNVDLADANATEEQKNKYKSTINITIELPDTEVLNGNIFGGGKLGAVDGDINVLINGGQINGNVYGGGKGEKGHLEKARVNGTTNVKVGY